MPDFANLSLGINLGLFAAAGVVVWISGSRLAGYADAIARLTGIGHAAIGLVLLALITSLPEVGVSVSAAASGNAALAVNNLIGSIAMQVALLAVIDFVIGRRALTSVIPEPAIMLQAALNVALLSVAAAASLVGDVQLLGAGAWSWACMVAYAGSVWLLSQSEGRRPWLAARNKRVDKNAYARQRAGEQQPGTSGSLPSVIARVAVAATAILLAGFVLSQTGDAIAKQTGLGSSFVGFVLIAVATSLPEVSTALSAARLGHFTMAISDILGTNLLNVGLFFLVDVVAPGDPVFNRVGPFFTFGAVLGIMLTALFAGGMAERRDRTFLRMGIDSISVLIVYLGGLVLLYNLRGSS